MLRCDFASVMQIIQASLTRGTYSTQREFVADLFDNYLSAGSVFIDLDNAQVNRWLKGKEGVNHDICQFYTQYPSHQEAMAEKIDDLITYHLSDRAAVVQKVYELLMQDPSVSESKKQELTALQREGDAEFLTAVIIFGLGRPFQKQTENGEISPPLQDFILDSALPKPCRSFCGRETELEELHHILMQEDKAFLRGIPGIGKSEIAKAYAKTYRKDYTNILYWIYSGSLKQDIANLQFADDKDSDSEEELFRRHNRFLRTLKEDTLIIIDNFNTTETQEELLPVLMKYRCRILFTTKSNFNEQTCLTVEEIADHAILYDLFASFFPDAEQCPDTVKAIMEAVHYHTLSIELAARLLQRGLLTPEQVLSKLEEEKAAFSGADEIRITKDGRTVRATYYQHVYTLFALFRLDTPQSYAMQCMSMVPLSGIPAKLFAQWAGLPTLNAVNELEEMGFLRRDDDSRLSLHPMMQDVTVADLVPGVDSCRMMLQNIGDHCCKYGREAPGKRIIAQITKNTIKTMQKDDRNFYVSFLEQVYVSVQDPSRPSDFIEILDELSCLLKDENVGCAEDRAILLSYQADLQHTSDTIIPLLQQAIDIFPAVTAENVRDICHLHKRIANLYRRKKQMELAQQHLTVAWELASRFPECYDPAEQLAMERACLLNDTAHFKEAWIILTSLEKKLRDERPNTYRHAAVLRQLAAVTANCGNPQKGLLLLDESMNIYQILCGNDDTQLQHYTQIITETRKVLLSMLNRPEIRIGGLY